MLNAMYSGISGLNANQRKLDVIGNNIANSGTTAFKGSRVTFQDSMRQSLANATGSSLNVGGTNPKQIGMGVQLQSIDVNTGQGNLQPTGRPLDVAIDQAGYFVVSKGPVTGKIGLDATNNSVNGGDMENYFTRDGAFRLTSEGYLVTPNGYRVMGYVINGSITHSADGIKATFKNADEALTAGTDLVPLAIPETVEKDGKEMKIQSYSIEKDGLLKATLSDGSVTVLGQLAMATFNNTGALEAVGQNMYTPTSNSGAAIVRTGKGAAADNGKAYGDMIQGCLEMSNVDLAEQFTDMIVASRSFQACSKVITTGDEILQELVNLKR